MIPPNRSILLRSIVKETETKQARQDKNGVKQRKVTRTEKSNKIESCVCVLSDAEYKRNKSSKITYTTSDGRRLNERKHGHFLRKIIRKTRVDIMFCENKTERYVLC